MSYWMEQLSRRPSWVPGYVYSMKQLPLEEVKRIRADIGTSRLGEFGVKADVLDKLIAEREKV